MSKVNHYLYHSRCNLAGTQGWLLCHQRITDTPGRHSRVRGFLAPHLASPGSTPYLPPRAMPSRRPHPSRVPLTDALLFRRTLTIFGTIKLLMSEGTSEISKSYPLVEHVNTKSLAPRRSSTSSYLPTSGTV